MCLANSWKHRGRCVAGIERTESGWAGWLRPISHRKGHSLSRAERDLAGSEPAPLDVVQLGVSRHMPMTYQTENWALDSEVRWKRVDRLPVHALRAFEDVRRDLWGTGHSSQAGLNDRVLKCESESHTHSLMLVRVKDPVIRVVEEGGRRSVRARFTFGDDPYDLSVTDPVCHWGFLARGPGEYWLAATHMTVSLAEPLNGYAYKVVAAVLGSDTRRGGVA